MQPKTHRLISVLLLAVLLLTLAAPALAQEPATAPIAAPEATCSPLSKDQQATFDRLAQLNEAGQLDSAGYDLFTKLGEQAGCAAPAAAPDAIEAVTGYAFSQSFSAYTELTGDTVFTVTGGGGTLDDGISATQTIPFTFNFGGTNFTSYRVNSNGWLGFGAPTQTLGYTALGGSVDNVIAFVNRDLNNVGAVYSSVTEGTAPNRIHKIQAKNFYRYNTASMTGNAQVWLYETSNVIEIRYGAFATNWDAGTVVQVGLRGVGTSDVRSLNGVGPTTWSNPTVGTSVGAFMDLALTVTPASGQVYTWTAPGGVAPVVPPYSQDFNGAGLPGWTVENTNGDINTWGVQTTYRRGTTGGAAGVLYNSSLAMNDWLFTPPLQLTGGVTYGVRFFYRAASASFPERMEVKWGAANSSAAMTNGPIFNDANITNTVMKEAIATFTPGSSGVYYVGFHGYSLADKFWLVVDDVTIYNTADSTWDWQGGVSNDWFVNFNWEGSIVPGELDQVKIPAVVRAPSASSPLIGSSSEASYGRVNNLTVDAGATLEVGAVNNLKVLGAVTNNGTLLQTKSVALGPPTVFLNITDGATTPVSKYFGVEMNPTSINMGNTTVTVSGNQQCVGVTNTTVKRCFTVTPTTPAAADIKFYFSEPEMTPTGQPLASQNVWNYHTGAWNPVTRGTDSGTCASGAINCFVQGTGIATYSPFAVGPSQPLAVTLASFTAQGGADRITVAWETVSEINNAGFNLYRGLQADGSDRALLTTVASQAPGSTQGAAYSYEDLAVEAGQTYWYWLEDVDLSGATTLHGPVSATVQTPTAVTLAGFEAAADGTASFAGLALAAGLAAAGGLLWRRRRLEVMR